jgi:hypothetical protein
MVDQLQIPHFVRHDKSINGRDSSLLSLVELVARGLEPAARSSKQLYATHLHSLRISTPGIECVASRASAGFENGPCQRE